MHARLLACVTSLRLPLCLLFFGCFLHLSTSESESAGKLARRHRSACTLVHLYPGPTLCPLARLPACPLARLPSFPPPSPSPSPSHPLRLLRLLRAGSQACMLGFGQASVLNGRPPQTNLGTHQRVYSLQRVLSRQQQRMRQGSGGAQHLVEQTASMARNIGSVTVHQAEPPIDRHVDAK